MPSLPFVQAILSGFEAFSTAETLAGATGSERESRTRIQNP